MLQGEPGQGVVAAHWRRITPLAHLCDLSKAFKSMNSSWMVSTGKSKPWLMLTQGMPLSATDPAKCAVRYYSTIVSLSPPLLRQFVPTASSMLSASLQTILKQFLAQATLLAAATGSTPVRDRYCMSKMRQPTTSLWS
eukprot:m.60464 g.60464  ORF g.60464 m.60464 type:complete len:138 (-) comp7031_c0_seq1:591-1004(-)